MGRSSVGVAPQYTSALGKNANCKTLISLTLASSNVPDMIGLYLSMPQSWTSDVARISRAKLLKWCGRRAPIYLVTCRS